MRCDNLSDNNFGGHNESYKFINNHPTYCMDLDRHGDYTLSNKGANPL